MDIFDNEIGSIEVRGLRFGLDQQEYLDDIQTWTGGPIGTPGDTDGNGIVDLADLNNVLLNWGMCPADPGCLGDLDGDGLVNLNDLNEVLLNWTTS